VGKHWRSQMSLCIVLPRNLIVDDTIHASFGLGNVGCRGCPGDTVIPVTTSLRLRCAERRWNSAGTRHAAHRAVSSVAQQPRRLLRIVI